jgi:FkbM family methyltransferase
LAAASARIDRPSRYSSLLIPDLIYDVGMHLGEDTEYYLKKGFRVLGIEADPELAVACEARFAAEVKEGRLVVLQGAVAEPGSDGGGTVTFYRNLDLSVWGTIDPSWADRNSRLGTRHVPLEVPRIDLAEVLRTHGVPHYMKIDIEGADDQCLRALEQVEGRPQYLSIESDRGTLDRMEGELRRLLSLGYRSFKVVQQVGISRQREPRPAHEGRWTGHQFAEGSSGLFGADLPGRWLDDDRVIERYRRIVRERQLWGEEGLVSRWGIAGTVIRRISSAALRRPLPGWYDTHARLAPAE